MINCCRVCKSKNIKNLFRKDDFPYFTSPLRISKIKNLNKILKNKKKSFTLDVAFCKDCSHVFLKKLPDQNMLNELYRKFYSYPSAIKDGFEPVRDNTFLKIFNNQMKNLNKRSTILEIGCFDGYIISKLKKIYRNISGCDPSPGAEIGKKKGLKIKRNFFSKNLYSNKFDVIIGRHVFEHLIDLDKFLKDISYNLNKDGILILEVPNVNFFLKNGLLTVFSLQHIQYFNKYSLKKILNLNNFNVKKIYSSQENLIIFCNKKKINSNIRIKKDLKLLKNFESKLKKNQKKLNEFIKKSNTKNNDIVIWGAGGAGYAVFKFYNLDIKKINFYVDIDKSKMNSRYFNIPKRIYAPTKSLLTKAKFILISSMYAENIISKLNKMKLKKKIITFFPKFNILNLK